MPPKPKVGLRRIDAALDAIHPMGFPKPLIRQTIKNLLKVYGGDLGWPFIEENSYEVVVKTILEEQGWPDKEDDRPELLENAEQTLLIENGTSKDDKTEARPEAQIPCLSEHSEQVQPPSNDSPPRKKLAIQACSPRKSSSPVANSMDENSQAKLETKLIKPLISAGVSSPLLPSPPVAESLPTRISAGVSSPLLPSPLVVESLPTRISAGVSSPLLPSPPAVETRPTRRRKPCYGWLSSDDEEEPEAANLVAADSLPQP
ncbi:uncharacterized protein LOC126660942 [Mercurialis annua]|uniref:uncharacterized protein LOC126660942 n=1 Tax=Mercurialis annua TaxID=3986 RepID=UPI00215FDCC7|nr:uncharacterized protein LOC126660942 [Mercurialis annua]